ncbi:unnamed protein product [Arabidopsis arenosa]|uniref:CDT1 Geminin-binding domain-containing protein n=1 Tax=Arabidopsis arenosa TaxID=38785 RepID=A0A8S2A683_ARAAE|nr:unnamed protein product [Arabidopsis arenosa]
MSAPGSSRSIPFKSKKRLVMDSPSSKSQTGNPNPSSVALPTPEKPLENMLSRSRNRSVALSVKEIRQAAGSRRRSEDPVASSAKSKLFFSHNDSPSSSPSKRISSNKNAEKEKLPEKYENLGKFFEALDNSMLLSKLRGSKPTFSNISKQIEHLTERRFCYSHLAQIKHILREAIEIKRVLIHDERTCCMKPDLHITLNADAVEYKDKSKSESKKIALRKVFRARLAEFVKAHPQGDEVPEEPLPEPFNRRKPDENSKVEVKSVSSLMEEMASIPAAKLFSSPITSTPVKTSSSPTKPTASQINIAPTSTPAKPTSSEINILPTPVKSVSTLSNIPSTPAIIDSTPVIAASTPPEFASTPPEFASTPARLMSTSLAARPLKRSSGHTNQDDISADPPTKLVRRSLSLNFDSYPEDEKAMDFSDDEPIDEVPEDLSSDDEILSILPDKLRHAIKEQERKAIEDQNPAISLAKRRRKMIACLPKLFNVIHYLIQSIRRWVITKEELVHKIIAGHSDITDRKEVEEQLILLQELVPEWMSEKKSSSGDVLVCINKLASPLTIRSRLEEENKQEMSPLVSSIPFKSKKRLSMDSPCSKPQIGNPNMSSVSLPTPEKPPENPTLDLHVSLNADAVEYDDTSKSESKRINLRKVFRARLAEFVKTHPQGDEVPEEPLPELFNTRKPNENSEVEVECVSSVMEEMASIPVAKLISSPITSTPSEFNIVHSTPAKIDSTPVVVASTPPEFASTPVRLFRTSLEARSQKRSSGSANADGVSTDPPVKLVRRSLLLNFDSCTEDKKAMDVTVDQTIVQVPEDVSSNDEEILSMLPDKLRQSIKDQEMKTNEDQNPAISLAKRRREMIACLPELFDVIHYIIQSIRRWVITKEELVHKIIAGHSDITDRKEVEEQLILMQELVPEWMSEKRSSSEDLLVFINKLASPLTIRSRLEEENKQEMASPLS